MWLAAHPHPFTVSFPSSHPVGSQKKLRVTHCYKKVQEGVWSLWVVSEIWVPRSGWVPSALEPLLATSFQLPKLSDLDTDQGWGHWGRRAWSSASCRPNIRGACLCLCGSDSPAPGLCTCVQAQTTPLSTSCCSTEVSSSLSMKCSGLLNRNFSFLPGWGSSELNQKDNFSFKEFIVTFFSFLCPKPKYLLIYT